MSSIATPEEARKLRALEAGTSVADVAQIALDELVKLRRQKEIDDALMPFVRDLAMATVEALRELKVASHQVIEAWRASSAADPDDPKLRAAIEDLVAASGWERGDE